MLADAEYKIARQKQGKKDIATAQNLQIFFVNVIFMKTHRRTTPPATPAAVEGTPHTLGKKTFFTSRKYTTALFSRDGSGHCSYNCKNQLRKNVWNIYKRLRSWCR